MSIIYSPPKAIETSYLETAALEFANVLMSKNQSDVVHVCAMSSSESINLTVQK
jgi:hypothetical protein